MSSTPDTLGRLLETVRILLDPTTLTNIQPIHDPESSLSTPPTPPQTPSPSRTNQLAISCDSIHPVDVNENDEAVEPANPLKSKRVTFADELVISVFETRERQLMIPSVSTDRQSDSNDHTVQVLSQLSSNEVLLSHGALLVVMLVAFVFYYWLAVDE